MTEESPTLKYTPSDDDTETYAGLLGELSVGRRGKPEVYRPLLICLNGTQKGQRFKLLAREATLGRQRGCDIVLTEQGVSRQHARITYENFHDPAQRPICSLEDLGSRNGTEINGAPIQGRVQINERDRISLAGTVLGFFVRDEEELLEEEHLYENATRDQLTGLDNRRQLLSHMRHYMGLAGRHQGMLSLVMIDIDDFKRVNDTHGHQVGDMALRHMAQVLASCVRESDLLARWGGEEFAICLPESSLANAAAFAERLRRCVRGTPFERGGISIAMTVSIGIAHYQLTDSTNTLFERADACLYAAKNGGKDRTVTETDLWPEDAESG